MPSTSARLSTGSEKARVSWSTGQVESMRVAGVRISGMATDSSCTQTKTHTSESSNATVLMARESTRGRTARSMMDSGRLV